MLDGLLLSCLPVGCALIVFPNTWNPADQFSKLLSNDTWSSSFESCRNRIPEARGSYLLLLKKLELFEGLCSTNCLCIGRIKNPSMLLIFKVLSIYVSFWRDYVFQIQRKFFSVSSVNGYSFLCYLPTQELQILFLMMQHFGVLDSVCLCVYGWTFLLRAWWFVNFLSHMSNSLFKSQHMFTNRVSRCNHSRAKDQVNKILCVVFWTFRFLRSNVYNLTFRVVLYMYLWLGDRLQIDAIVWLGIGKMCHRAWYL